MNPLRWLIDAMSAQEPWDPPTEEHSPVPPHEMRIGPRLEEFGPGRPVPPGAPRGEQWDNGDSAW
jgi:hypothetical protein